MAADDEAAVAAAATAAAAAVVVVDGVGAVAKFRREVALELVSQAVYTDRAIKQAIELLKERHRGMISPEDMDAVAAGLKRELGLS